MDGGNEGVMRALWPSDCQPDTNNNPEFTKEFIVVAV